MGERKNIVKTTKTKYAITKFWWWNLKKKFQTILKWENLSGEKSLGEKKFESFSKSLEIGKKISPKYWCVGGYDIS